MDAFHVDCRVEKFEAIDEAVFGQRGDRSLPGSLALARINRRVDPRRKHLAVTGAVVAAGRARLRQ